MNKPTNLRRFGRQSLAAVVSATLVLGPMAPAYAATTALADVPIAAKVAAKPNIVYTVDDSGSMASNFIPDFVTAGASTSVPAFCRGNIQFTSQASGFQPFYQKDTTSTYNVATTACGAGSLTIFNFPPFYAADFNHLAYNPGITYAPPIQADLTPLAYGAPYTDSSGNQIDLTQVQSDPYVSPTAISDLSQKTAVDANGVTYVSSVSVPIFCNSDWPLIGKMPYDHKSSIAALVVGDVGDAYGEHMAGSGNHCRINGTDYDGDATLGTPAATADYNYPRPKVGATVGTASGKPFDVAYFYRNNSLRQLWCDTGAPGWPIANGSCTLKCPPPGATS